MNFFFFSLLVHEFRIPCNRSRRENTGCDVSACDEFRKKKDRNERRFREKFAYLGGWLSTGSPWTFYECKYRCSYRLPAFPSSFSLFLALFVLSAYSQLFLTWTADPLPINQPFIHDSFAASGMELSTLFPSSKEWIIFSLERTRRDRFIDRKRI